MGAGSVLEGADVGGGVELIPDALGDGEDDGAGRIDGGGVELSDGKADDIGLVGDDEGTGGFGAAGETDDPQPANSMEAVTPNRVKVVVIRGIIIPPAGRTPREPERSPEIERSPGFRILRTKSEDAVSIRRSKQE